MDLDKNMSILQVESARINKPADDLEFPGWKTVLKRFLSSQEA
jgi:hypothetical protein